MRRGRLLIPAIVLLALAPAAQAGTVTRSEAFGRSFFQSLTYAAAPGEQNLISVSVEGKSVLIRDSAGVTAGEGCTRPDPADTGLARCDFTVAAESVMAGFELGDENDELAALPKGIVSVDVKGGPGADKLAGSNGFDTLAGGPGPDSVQGRGSNDSFFEEEGGDAPDVLSGGAGFDFVDYSGRSEAVSLDLDGEADDGAAGEGDRIGADVESLQGGDGDDLLVAGDGERLDLTGGPGDDRLVGGSAVDGLFGEAGNDRISGSGSNDVAYGGPGNDEVDGGEGPDFVNGDGGDDRIIAQGGGSDTVGCQAGADEALVDVADMVKNGCERVDRNGRAAALSPVLPGLGFVVALSVFEDALEMPVGCPADFAGSRCRGVVRIRSGGRETGRHAFEVRRGGIRNFNVRLDNVALRRLGRLGQIGVVALVRTRLPGGGTATRRTTFSASG